MQHVDEFIDDLDTDNYASFVLNWFRAPAMQHARYGEWMRQFKLFCTYGGKRYRVTGASRLGDVWLSSDFERETGYESRVDVAACSDWSNHA
jgi:hypothetical protein